MLKIRRPLGRLIFNMGIDIPGKTVFLIETAPRLLWCLMKRYSMRLLDHSNNVCVDTLLTVKIPGIVDFVDVRTNQVKAYTCNMFNVRTFCKNGTLIKVCRALINVLLIYLIKINSENVPESKVHGANMGPTWVLSALGGPHVGPMNLAIRGYISSENAIEFSQNFHMLLSTYFSLNCIFTYICEDRSLRLIIYVSCSICH